MSDTQEFLLLRKIVRADELICELITMDKSDNEDRQKQLSEIHETLQGWSENTFDEIRPRPTL